MMVYIIDDDFGDIQQLEEGLLGLKFVTSVTSYYGFDTAKTILLSLYEDDAVTFPDIVIIEAKLNDGPAPSLIKLLRKCEGTSMIPILVYTSTEDEELKSMCLESGANKFFRKEHGTAGRDALVAYVAAIGSH
jgi:DNA-binding response OmpR family regulator